MRIFTQGILGRRKIVFLFLLAILLPSLVVGYLSYKTFAEKQKAVQNLLESNLWISGESVLKTIEDNLLELEKSTMKKENFERWIQPGTLEKSVGGKPFLLDENFKMLFPMTASSDTSDFDSGKDLTDSPFYQAFQNAESFEFAQRDYYSALEGYIQSLSLAAQEFQKAFVLEAIGRCFLAQKNYLEAHKAYSGLASKYGQYLNKAGHPYEITANLQLIEIGKYLNNKDKDLGILVRLIENLQNGEYPVTLPVYEFFQNEILEILDAELGKNDYQSRSSPYLETLLFASFLETEAIPKLTEKRSLNRLGEDAQIGRFLTTNDESDFLVSYCVFPDFQDKKTFYGGYCWDLEALKTDVFLDVLKNLEKNAKLQLRIIDDKGRNVFTGNEEDISDEALPLSFRQFPLPWNLVVTQPALDDVVRATRRDNVFYGFLLGFVVVLMLLGAILLARDISRETETTRLKTPLTLIRLYGETLQRKKDLSKSEKAEAYEIITKESERLSHLINNVLDFSRIEMGKKEFDFKMGNLVAVVRDTLDSYRYHLEKKGFLIREDIATDLPEMMFEAEGVASVLINLLSNAIKFSSASKEVTVRLYQKDDFAVLQVEDKGIGISSKEISRVFEKFYRSKDVKAADAKGSGLGLTLVKHITEAHLGHVEVQSEPDRGSTFTVFLPLSNPTQG